MLARDTNRSADGLPPLPPPFRAVALREGGDAVREAVQRAIAGEGAGALAWVRAYGRAEAALVLEPELPLGAARLALPAAANALADALAIFGAPEIPLGFRWPATLRVNGATCGGLSLHAPAGVAATAVPDWLVVGFECRLAFPEGREPGGDAATTSLFEEGFSELTPAALVGGFARHLLAGLDDWTAHGPQRLAERYLARLLDPAEAPGLRRGLDPNTGELIMEHDGTTSRRAMLP